MFEKVEECRLLHERQRKKLDAELESNPLESSFSAQLMDLMQREEQAANQGLLEVQEQISKRVDSVLKSETFRHFKMQAQHFQRRWLTLLDRQVAEREKISQEVSDSWTRLSMLLGRQVPPDYTPIAVQAAQIHARDQNANRKVNPKKLKNPDGSIDMDAFWEEEMRMRLEVYRDWPQHERNNLQMAFNLQVQRVETEWSTYEVQMRADYEAQRSKLEGKCAEIKMSSTVPGGSSSGGKWKDKEKQSRLIHTAPVFTPEAGGAIRSRSPNRLSTDKNVQKELEQLDSAFEDARARIQFQKRSALRWISRQSARMEVQIQTMEPYRQMVHQYLEKEFNEYKLLRPKSKEIVQMSEALKQRVNRGAAHESATNTLPSGPDTSALKRPSTAASGSDPNLLNSRQQHSNVLLVPIDSSSNTPKSLKPEAWNKTK